MTTMTTGQNGHNKSQAIASNTDDTLLIDQPDAAAMAVLLETSKGDIVIDLFVEECPMTCKSFLKLCKCVQMLVICMAIRWSVPQAHRRGCLSCPPCALLLQAEVLQQQPLP